MSTDDRMSDLTNIGGSRGTSHNSTDEPNTRQHDLVSHKEEGNASINQQILEELKIQNNILQKQQTTQQSLLQSIDVRLGRIERQDRGATAYRV